MTNFLIKIARVCLAAVSRYEAILNQVNDYYNLKSITPEGETVHFITIIKRISSESNSYDGIFNDQKTGFIILRFLRLSLFSSEVKRRFVVPKLKLNVENEMFGELFQLCTFAE